MSDGDAIMNTEIKDSLMNLADFLEETHEPLVFTLHLRIQGNLGYGFSMLGLVCQAHYHFTRKGRWIFSNPNVRELPDYETGGEITDRYLPKTVVEYFGFRDDVGSFNVADLNPKIRRSMYKNRKFDTSSLYEIGLEYRRQGKRIAADVIREMPASLLAARDCDGPPTTLNRSAQRRLYELIANRRNR